MRSNGEHFADFARTACRHTKGKWAESPVELEGWQRDFADEAFRVDENGKRIYRQVLLGVPRKNGKSTLCAALALYFAVADGEPGAEVIIASGSREQAAIVFDQARAFVETSPILADYLSPQRFVITGEGSVIRRVSADGRLQHGLSPNAVICDELHAFTTPRQEELWNALQTGSGAREQPMTIAITTAGYDKSTVLGRLYDAAMRLPDVEFRDGLTISRDYDAGFLFWWYGMKEEDDHEDRELWSAVNPSSWIGVDYLEQQAASPTVDRLAFDRLHLNRWTRARSSWLPSGLWQSLESEDRIADGATVYVGVDVGLVHDSTAVAIACPLEDGRILVEVKVWAARRDAVAHVHLPGGRVDLDIIEEYIEDLAEKYHIAELVYDPRFFERSAQNLSMLGVAIAPVDQASRLMQQAYADFYLLCREEKVQHTGDEVLAMHVESTMAVMTDRGWKISRHKQRRIDALVASAMAVWRAKSGQAADYVLAWDDDQD